MNYNLQSPENRMQQLKEIAELYFQSLTKKNFEGIPYAVNVSLRSPLTPGGVNVPLNGKEELYHQWWLPLETALAGVKVNILGHYFHENLEGIFSEAEITLVNPAVTLRVADRFLINAEGKITDQEIHFDPRAVTDA